MAWLDVEARRHARVLRAYDEDEMADIAEDMLDLPASDMSLQFPVPRLLSPELESLREAVVAEDIDKLRDALPAAMAQIDTPPARAALARAVICLQEAGRVEPATAAAAVLDLACSPTSRLLRNSLFEALAVSAGSVPTPSGLLVAAR